MVDQFPDPTVPAAPTDPTAAPEAALQPVPEAPAAAPEAVPQPVPEAPAAATAPAADVAGLAEGRIVHYHAPGVSGCLAAVVAYVWRGVSGELPADGLCNLAVVNDGVSQSQPVEIARSVVYSADARERTWHWPERA